MIKYSGTKENGKETNKMLGNKRKNKLYASYTDGSCVSKRPNFKRDSDIMYRTIMNKREIDINRIKLYSQGEKRRKERKELRY